MTSASLRGTRVTDRSANFSQAECRCPTFLKRRPTLALGDPPRPDQKFERLIASAAHLFATQGYLGSHIEDVCEHAGLSVDDFYDHFGNKADLMLHVARETLKVLAPPAVATLDELEKEIAALVWSQNAAIIRAWVEATRVEPRLKEAHEAIRQEQLLSLRAWVTQLREERAARTGLEERAAARAAIAILRDLVVATHEPVAERVADSAHAIWFLLFGELSHD